MQALFSPEILEAVEVKGLREEPTLPEIENNNAQSISQDRLADRRVVRSAGKRQE